MEAQSIHEYERLEKYYWWFVGRRLIIDAVLRKYFGGKKLRILDWGCGPGGNFNMLRNYGEVLGVDASDEALSECREKGITTVTKARELNEFKADTKFDLVTNFDVLEHISEDEQYLRGLHALLTPGGYAMVTVPAYQFLWSGLDEVVGHKRRYTRREICQKFNRAGYTVVRASYFIFFLSPAFIVFRMFQKLKKENTRTLKESVVELPRWLNWLFVQIVSIESMIIPRLSLPFGTSIIVLAKKI